MSDFKQFFDAFKESIEQDDFVKLTLSKPLRKSEGLLNVYVRLLKVEGKEILEFKYRYITESKFKEFSLNNALAELETLLLQNFRGGTLFTLDYDLLVMVSKKKKVSCRDTAPSFRNKLPDFTKEK